MPALPPTRWCAPRQCPFDDIIEDTTDKLLVLNILRAKDKAPLHFDEIPSIHESVTGSTSVQAVWPFGPLNKSVARNTLTAGANIQLAPSFEIDNLATKDFVTGMSTPIDPKFVKYWLDRGLDRRVVLLLFFSAIDVTVSNSGSGSIQKHTIRIRNSPRDAIDALYASPPAIDTAKTASLGARELNLCKGQTDFQHYLKLINNLTSFTAQSAPQKKAILEGISGRPGGFWQDHRLGGGNGFRQDLGHIQCGEENILAVWHLRAQDRAVPVKSAGRWEARGTPEAQNTCNGADVATSADVATANRCGCGPEGNAGCGEFSGVPGLTKKNRSATSVTTSDVRSSSCIPRTTTIRHVDTALGSEAADPHGDPLGRGKSFSSWATSWPTRKPFRRTTRRLPRTHRALTSRGSIRS